MNNVYVVMRKDDYGDDIFESIVCICATHELAEKYAENYKQTDHNEGCFMSEYYIEVHHLYEDESFLKE